jgi:hypothetical protein
VQRIGLAAKVTLCDAGTELSGTKQCVEGRYEPPRRYFLEKATMSCRPATLTQADASLVIAYAIANPGRVNLPSPAAGLHPGVFLQAHDGHQSGYSESSRRRPALLDVLFGSVPVMFESILFLSLAARQARSTRLPRLADVPTVSLRHGLVSAR